LETECTWPMKESCGLVSEMRSGSDRMGGVAYLGYFDAVDFEVGVGVGLDGLDDLLDGYRSQCIFTVCLISLVNRVIDLQDEQSYL
jgi:hypothetical protein